MPDHEQLDIFIVPVADDFEAKVTIRSCVENASLRLTIEGLVVGTTGHFGGTTNDSRNDSRSDVD